MAQSYWDSLDTPTNVTTPQVGSVQPTTQTSTPKSYWDSLDASIPVSKTPKLTSDVPVSIGGGLSQSFTTGLGTMTGRLLDQILHASAQTIKGYEGLTDAQLSVIEKGFEKFGLGTKKLKQLRETDFTGKLEQYREKLKRNIEVGAEVSREANPFASTFAGQTAEVFGGLVPQVGLAFAKAPQIALALSESVMNVEDSYDENIKKGMSKEEAFKRAIPQLGADLAGTYITNKLGTFSKLSGASKSMFKSRIAETLKDSTLEIAQEVWQQGLQNLATDKPFTEGMGETAKLTIIPALLFGAAGNIGSIQAQKETKQKVTQAVAVMQQKIANGEPLTEQEQALQAITGGIDPFVQEKTPAVIPPILTTEEAIVNAQAKVEVAQQEVPVSERLSLQEVTNDLVDTGYTKADVTRIMADLYAQSPEGTFTRQQLEDIKGDYYPQIKSVTTITKDLQSSGYTEEQISKIITDLYTSKPEGDFLNADINVETQKVNNKDLYNIVEEQKAVQDKKDEKLRAQEAKILERQKAQEEKQKVREEKMLERQKALDEKQKLQEAKVVEKQKKLDQKVADAKLKIEEKNKKEQTRLREKQDRMNKFTSDIKSKIKESNAKLDEIRAKRNTWVTKADQLSSKIQKSKKKVNTSIAKARLIEIKTKIKTIETIIETRLKNIAELEIRLKNFEQALTKGDAEIKKILDENTTEVKKIEDSVKTERLNLIEEIKRIKNEIKKQKDALLTEDVNLETVTEPEQVVEVAPADEVVPIVKEATPTTSRGEMKTSKTAERLAQKLVEDGVPVDFLNRAQYQTKNIEEEFKKVAELINSDFDKAVAVIEGIENLPNGIEGELLLEKMREYLSKNRNPELEYKLLNSPLLTKISESAQSLRFAREINTDSVIGKSEAIKKEREKQVGEKIINDLQRDLNAIIKITEEMNLSEDDLNFYKFLDENKC